MVAFASGGSHDLPLQRVRLRLRLVPDAPGISVRVPRAGAAGEMRAGAGGGVCGAHSEGSRLMSAFPVETRDDWLRAADRETQEADRLEDEARRCRERARVWDAMLAPFAEEPVVVMDRKPASWLRRVVLWLRVAR